MLGKLLILALLSISYLCFVTGEFYDDFYKPRRVVIGEDFELDGIKPFKPLPTKPPTIEINASKKRNKPRRRPSTKNNHNEEDERAEFILKKMFLDFNRMVKTGFRNTRKVVGNYVQGVRKMTGSGSRGGGSGGSGSKKNYKNYDRVDEEENDGDNNGLYVDMNPVWGIMYQPSD